MHPASTLGVGVGVWEADAVEVTEGSAVEVAPAELVGSLVADVLAGFGAVTTLATQTNPMTASSTPMTASTGCLSRTSPDLLDAPSRRDDSRRSSSLGKEAGHADHDRSRAVSYTHLDVYKRQVQTWAGALGVLPGVEEFAHPGAAGFPLDLVFGLAADLLGLGHQGLPLSLIHI